MLFCCRLYCIVFTGYIVMFFYRIYCVVFLQAILCWFFCWLYCVVFFYRLYCVVLLQAVLCCFVTDCIVLFCCTLYCVVLLWAIGRVIYILHCFLSGYNSSLFCCRMYLGQILGSDYPYQL